MLSKLRGVDDSCCSERQFNNVCDCHIWVLQRKHRAYCGRLDSVRDMATVAATTTITSIPVVLKHVH